jgi:hypothetical protein
MQMYWSTQAAPARERERLWSEVLLALLQGQFDDALGLIARWDESIAGEPDEVQHERVGRILFRTLQELGDTDGIRHTARTYLERANTWTPTNFFPDTRIEAMSALYAIGDVPRSDFVIFQRGWAKSMEEQNRATPAGRWFIGWAAPAKDAIDARSAMESLPNEMPFEDLLARDTISEEAIGNAFGLAGNTKVALEHFVCGAHACTAVRQPLQNTYAHFRAGQAYELLGEKQRACDAYRVVVRRWGGAV